MICQTCKKDDGEVVTCGGVIVLQSEYPLPWLCDACAEDDREYDDAMYEMGPAGGYGDYQ